MGPVLDELHRGRRAYKEHETALQMDRCI
jgi:hypothetical protein